VAAGPVGVPFAADDEAADLVIAADLPAGQESAVVTVAEFVRKSASVQLLLDQAPLILAPT
jgi:hypothetical protein